MSYRAAIVVAILFGLSVVLQLPKAVEALKHLL